VIEQDCRYEPPHTHSWPDDWIFGGADNQDPRADPRHRSSVYIYIDSRAREIHRTVVPLCDDQALDEFTKVANFGPDFDPAFLQAKRPDGKVDVLPWQYDADSDTLYPLESR